MTKQFVHLHVHSEFSMVDGIVRIKPLTKALNGMRSPAVALTDHGNLFAAVKIYQASLSQGVKPILGAECVIRDESLAEKSFRLVFLCQNNVGYHNLTCLISKSYQEGQVHGSPMIERSWLNTMSEGLIVLSAGSAGDIGQLILAGENDKAKNALEHWLSIFQDRFYLELQRTKREGEDDYNQAAINLAEMLDVPVVATNDVRFITPDDFEAHEARTCIHDGYVLDDSRRPKRYSKEQYLKSPEQMDELFADIPEAIINTVEIAKRCNTHLELGKNYLPNFPIPDGMSVEAYLEQVSKQGLEERLTVLFKDKTQDAFIKDRVAYDERIQIELDVINNMGFPGYFLIVADFIQWAKDNRIPVGPGRGSGAGSLVAYALKITDLDPLEYDLLFERFLNPERVSMPDFDVDFCMEGRDRVIDYVAEKYGRQSVSQIITFGTMAAKAVVRDVGRVLGHPYGFVDRIAKLIPFEIGMTLTKALEQEEEFQELYENDDEVKGLLDLALKLEGITRNAGKHAGGVVISPGALTDFSAIYCEQDSKQIVSQFDKDDVESVGLVKFDFLGLRTLTIINWAVLAIKRYKNVDINIDVIPTDDVDSFKLLKACDTTAVFQLESRGMKDLIGRLQPDCFEDIVALVALFRPGPLQSGMVDDFIDRKHGRAKVEYPHPDLEPILQPTYGVILYQEQVMQIAQVLAGYSLGAADMLRRAMGKKKPEEMAKQRVIFTEGALARGVEEETATYIFDLMEKFAGYGFNKSHSAAYALVAYQTAWLKAHYPAAFMSAVLSSDMDNTDKVVTFIDDCRKSKLHVIPPCINESLYKFRVKDDRTIVYGIGAIKGVGEAAIESIIQEREQNGLYSSLFDLCKRVDIRKVNRRVLEALIRAGAFDSFKIERSVLFASIAKALKVASQHANNASVGQFDLFADEPESLSDVAYLDSKTWPIKQRLNGEKETLGLYLTGHPIDEYKTELKHYTKAVIRELIPKPKSMSLVAGLILSVRKIITKRGKKMAIVTIDDNTARLDIALFSEVLDECQDKLVKDEVLLFEGEISVDDFNGGIKMSAQKIFSIDDARAIYAKKLWIKMNKTMIGKLNAIEAILAANPGELPVLINYNAMTATGNIQLSNNYNVTPRADLLSALSLEVGETHCELEF